MSKQTKYIVITPVRDEAAYIGKTIAAMAAQTIAPQRWIVVDDGSKDGTGEILDREAARIPWMQVVHRADRGYRAAGGGVVQAFNTGYAEITAHDWDYVVKLDGDLSFAPDYFEQCFSRFDADPKLGIGGGVVCSQRADGLHVDSVGDPPFHVRGATKIYKRACWDRIAPLAAGPGWDTVDEIKANFHGWATRTFSDLPLVQHKPTGAAAGKWNDAMKNGRANYLTGYHPMFMLAKCAKRALRRPYLVESAALMAGFCSCYLKRMPKLADRDVVRYVRQQQLRRLLLRPSIYG